jgi:hypothetical protein
MAVHSGTIGGESKECVDGGRSAPPHDLERVDDEEDVLTSDRRDLVQHGRELLAYPGGGAVVRALRVLRGVLCIHAEADLRREPRCRVSHGGNLYAHLLQHFRE